MMIEPFDYVAPTTVAAALLALNDPRCTAARIRILGGGQLLIPALSRRETSADRVIDVGRVPELRQIHLDGSALRVGSAVTHAELLRSPLVEKHFPVLIRAAASISDPMVKNRASVGGAALNADPAADWLCLFKLLDAKFEFQCAMGSAYSLDAAASDVPRNPTANDLLTHVVIPLPPPGSLAVYEKIRHTSSGYARVGVASMLIPGSTSVPAGVRLALTGTVGRPQRLHDAERIFERVGQSPDELRQALTAEINRLVFLTDGVNGADYNRHVTLTVVLRALTQLALFPSATRPSL